MKKIVSMIVLFMVSAVLFAQQDVTQFLGIPVDGTKSEMIQKLKTKGFQYNSTYDRLEGEFNGSQVYLSVLTNNNKVWRIMVKDAVPLSENSIKNRYNRLYRQFMNNNKYVPLPVESNRELSDDEDISYEISVHDKQYEAVFFQLPTDSASIVAYAQERLLQKYTEEQALSLTDEEKTLFAMDLFLEYVSKKVVWFTIKEDSVLGRGYIIVMYYDNEYNHSNGEDL